VEIKESKHLVLTTLALESHRWSTKSGLTSEAQAPTQLTLRDMGFARPLELGLSAQGQEGWGQAQRKRPSGVAGLRKCEIPIVY